MRDGAAPGDAGPGATHLRGDAGCASGPWRHDHRHRSLVQDTVNE